MVLDVEQARVLQLPLVVLVRPGAPDPVPDEPVRIRGGLLKARLALVLLTQLHLRSHVSPQVDHHVHLDADLLLVLLLGAHLLVVLLLLVLGTRRLVALPIKSQQGTSFEITCSLEELEVSVLFSFFGTGLCVQVMASIHIHIHIHIRIHIHIHNNNINSSTLLAFSIGYSEVLVEVSYCRQFRLKPRVQSLMDNGKIYNDTFIRL